MSDSKRELSIRLSAEGGAELTNTFRQLGTAGEQAFQQIDKSAGASSGNLDQLDRKLAGVAGTARQTQTALQQQINAAVGIGTGAAGSAQDSANVFRYQAAQQAAQASAQMQAAQAQINALLGVGRATGGGAAASAAVFAEAEQEMAALDAQAQQLIARYDPLTAAQVKYAQGVDTANKLLAAGKITTEQHAAALAGEKTALNAVAQQFDPLNSKVKLSYTNMEILRSGAVNVVQSLAAGMDPIQVFTTQLAQTAPALGAVASNAGLSAAALFALGVPVAAIVAGLGALGIAYERGQGQAQEFARAQQATSNAAGLTAQGLNDIVDAATQASTIGPQAARAIATQMEASGKLAGDVIARLTALTADYAAATKQSVADAGKDLTSLFADPQRALQQLDAAYNLLSASERRHVQDLIDQGDKTSAQIELADKLNARVKNLSSDGMGYLEKAWHTVSEAASGAWDAMLGVGRGQTLDQQLDAARARLAQLQADAAELNRASNENNPQQNLRVDANNAAIEATRKLIDDLQAQSSAATTEASQQAQASHVQELSKQYDSAARSIDTFGQKQHDLSNTMTAAANAARDIQAALDGLSGATSGPDLKRIGELNQALTNTKAVGANAAAELKALQTPLDQAEKSLDIARQVAALPTYQRGPQQVYLTTLQQDQNSADPTVRAQAEAHAEAVKTQAILEQNRALADQNQTAQVNHDLALTVADAWSKGQAAGTEADAARQAALDHLNSGVDVTQRKLEILRQASDDGLKAASQQVAALQEQARQTELVSDASQRGRAAAIQAQLNQKIADATKDARTGFSLAISSGDIQAADQYRQKIAEITDAITELDAAQRQTDFQGQLDGQRDQIELLQRQIDLVDQNNKAQAVGLAQTQAEIELRREGKSATDAQGLAYIQNAEKIATLNSELQRQRDIADELPQFFDQAFDRIGSALTDASVQTGTWADSFKNLGNVGLGILSELEQELLKLSVINPLKNLLNGDSALPDLSGLFGRLFNTTDFQISNMIASNPGIFADGGVMTSKGRAELPMYRYQEGGVAYRPQLALFGEGDEPEAYVPLKGGAIPVRLSMPDRVRAAAMPTAAVQGGGVEVNVYNYGNDQVKTQTQQQPNGKQLVSLFIGEAAKDVAANGVLGQQIRKTYGVTQQAAVRR